MRMTIYENTILKKMYKRKKFNINMLKIKIQYGILLIAQENW